MRSGNTQAPRVPRVTLADLMDGDPDTLVSNGLAEGLRFTRLTLDDADLAGLILDQCELIGVSADGASLHGAHLSETRLDKLDAARLGAARGEWREVEVTGSRLGSAEFHDSRWRSVHLRGCRIGYLNLRGAELHDVLIEDCVIDDLDLGGARATRVAFADTRVNALDITGATLSSVDLRTLNLHTVSGLENLAGATICTAQAAEFATLFAERLGLTVID